MCFVAGHFFFEMLNRDATYFRNTALVSGILPGILLMQHLMPSPFSQVKAARSPNQPLATRRSLQRES
jgi:hypothetical protein